MDEVRKEWSTSWWSQAKLKVTLYHSAESRHIDHVDVIPTTSAMLMKALYYPNTPKRDRYRHRVHQGDIPKEVIVEIAKIRFALGTRADTLKGAVKEVLGTYRGMGKKVFVDGMTVPDTVKAVNNGEWDALVDEPTP